MNPELTTISTSGYLFIFCMGAALLFLPRRLALVPLFMSGCYMTLAQVLLVGPLHFSIFRIVLLLGCVRIVVRKELANTRFNRIDKILVAWTLTSALIYILNRGVTSEAVVAQLGISYNTFASYFFARAVVRDRDDIVRAVKSLGVVIVVLSVFFMVEYETGRNVFSVLGGVSEFSQLRDGKLRCQGAFGHPILAGTFAATAMPLFVGLWVQSRRSRLLASSALVASAIIVFTSSSSGPILAFVIGIAGLMFWRLRNKLRIIRWCAVLSLISLHIIMNAPSWFLITHISDWLGMGSGWHRSALIDASIRHFDEWWLMGTNYTAHWMPTGLANDSHNTDITNQFIAEGIRGGLISLCLFIWLLTSNFKVVGKAIRDKIAYPIGDRFIIWTLGCALLGHVASFISVTYFDQMVIFWYWLLAAIACLAVSRERNARVSFINNKA